MSANGYLIDGLTKHQMLIQRFAAGQVKLAKPIIVKMARDIRAALLRQDLTSFQTARLQVLRAEIDAIASAAGVALQAQVTPSMQDFAAYEAQFTQRLLQGAVTVSLAGVATDALIESIPSLPVKLVSGKKTVNTTFAGMFNIFSEGSSKEVMTAVQAGISSGLTTQQIASQVFGMVNSRTRAQAETVVRTAANASGSAGRESLYATNADVLDGEEWVSTLDGRSRISHAALDGNVYALGAGPQTPLGYNCRCIRVPRVKEEFAVLRKGATRASMDGPVSSQTVYNSFLKRQGKGFQDEWLGKTRADLFRNGGLSVDKFADDSGRTYTLLELQQREPLAFERAGVEL